MSFIPFSLSHRFSPYLNQRSQIGIKLASNWHWKALLYLSSRFYPFSVIDNRSFSEFLSLFQMRDGNFFSFTEIIGRWTSPIQALSIDSFYFSHRCNCRTLAWFVDMISLSLSSSRIPLSWNRSLRYTTIPCPWRTTWWIIDESFELHLNVRGCTKLSREKKKVNTHLGESYVCLKYALFSLFLNSISKFKVKYTK